MDSRFQDTFETRNRSFIGAFSSCMAVPLIKSTNCLQDSLSIILFPLSHMFIYTKKAQTAYKIICHVLFL